MVDIISDSSRICDIDKDERKNKFLCYWLTRIIELKFGENEKDVRVGDCINKVDVSRKALCSLYVDYVDYRKKAGTQSRKIF